jgi:hypothetical protein
VLVYLTTEAEKQIELQGKDIIRKLVLQMAGQGRWCSRRGSIRRCRGKPGLKQAGFLFGG